MANTGVPRKYEDGGMAFPGPCQYESTVNLWEGMTLRDYFAAMALAGLLPKLPLVDQCGQYGRAVQDKIAHNNEIAESCYALADAMLKARKS